MTTPQWITDAAREIEDTFLAHDAISDIAAIIASHYTAAHGWRPIEQPKEDERAKQD